MKKGAVLNSQLSAVIAEMGHGDALVIGDAGLPIPAAPKRIDLALTENIPSFMHVLEATIQELCVEHVVLAEEIKMANPAVHEAVLAALDGLALAQGKEIGCRYVSHEHFKAAVKDARAVVRSGECSPYANIILYAGVTF